MSHLLCTEVGRLYEKSAEGLRRDVVAMCEQHSSGLTNPLLLQKLADKHNVSEETARTRVKEAVSTHRVDKDGKLIKPKKGYELNQNRIPNTVPDELGKAV